MSSYHALRRASDQQLVARATHSTQRLSANALLELPLAYHTALDAVRTGQATGDHTSTLAVACNAAMVLCEMGLGDDWLAGVREAQDALVTLEARRRRIGRYIPTGIELQRLNTLVELHDAQLASDDCTEGLMTRALLEMQRRMAAGDVREISEVPA